MNVSSSVQQVLEKKDPRLWHIGVLSALLLLAYLSYVGAFKGLLHLIINDHIEQVSRAYIKTTAFDTAWMLEILSATKAALALLQSSSGGISFIVDVQIQLGQILNVVTELIDRAWLVSLGALAAVEALGLLLDISKLSMAPVLTLFFVTLGISYGLQTTAPRPAHAISHVAKLAMMLALVVHFVIPLTIYGTASVGNFFFLGQKHEIRQGFRKVHATTPKHDLRTGLHKEIKSVIKKFKHAQGSIHSNTSTISRLTGNHILLSIAEHLVVPLVIMALLYLMFRQFLEKLWSK